MPAISFTVDRRLKALLAWVFVGVMDVADEVGDTVRVTKANLEPVMVSGGAVVVAPGNCTSRTHSPSPSDPQVHVSANAKSEGPEAPLFQAI